MSRASCNRAWQAEASLDRRISADDRASFERHLQTCATCARELEQLTRLKQWGERLPWPKTEPLQRRRQRNELLRRAHAGEAVGASRFAWRWAVAPLLLLCLVALGVVTQRKLRVEAPVAREAAVIYEVRPEPGSAWSKLAGGDAVRLALEDGALAIHVSKLKSGQSFRVQLPDGELEVRGTRFMVQAGVTHTERVTVSEGRVALRVGGRPAVLLGAGDTWQRTTAPALSAVPSAAAPPSVAVAPPSARRAGPALRGAPATAAPVATEGAGEPSPASDFAVAMASFSRGDFATAEQLFQRFEARHPRSSQVEDSLFLRALSRLRRGDELGARALAAEYLRRYPNGFRASEAARLVNVP